MAVRTGMISLILELRRMTDASSNEVTIDGVQYWTDQQLQDLLDSYRVDVLDLELIPAKQRENGADVYYRYYLPDSVGAWVENDPSVFQVVDEDGNLAAGYTFNTIDRYVLFTSNTSGATRLLRCRYYDLRKTAARVWYEKAGHRVQLIDWKAGGQNLNEDQEYQHCMEMFNGYSGNGGVKSILPMSTSRATKRLRKAGYSGQNNSSVEYYPTGTEQSNKSPFA